MKYILTITLVFLFTLIPSAYASEVTGTITTGLSAGNNLDGLVIEQPTASPVAGTYTTSQSVILSGGPGTQSIHYTTDGSAATCSSGNTYSTAISVTSSLVIEAISCYPNNIASPTILFGYAINPPSAPGPSGGGGGPTGGGVPVTPATVATDFNGDGKIDVFDFNILITNWGATGATQAMGDANGDGTVDIFDFNLLIANWQA